MTGALSPFSSAYLPLILRQLTWISQARLLFCTGDIEMPVGYTKLDNGIITSSIWSADSDIRVVWITLLAMSDAKGLVETSLPGLARIANVSLEICEKAIAYLESPDPYSRSKDHEGRRIKQIDGGFFILNKGVYREKDYGRADYWREWRNKAQHSATPAQQSATHTDTDAKADTDTKADKPPISPPGGTDISSELFEQFKEARMMYPGTKRGAETELGNLRKKYPKEWRGIIPAFWQAIGLQIDRRKELKKKGEFVPPWKHLKTYINNACWESDIG
jgi:hypothetical protein